MSSPQILVRKAVLSDTPSITLLGKKTFLETYQGMMNHDDLLSYVTESFSVKKLVAELGDPNNAFFVAESGSELAGYCKLALRAPHDCIVTPVPGQFVRSYVDQRYQGFGLGKRFFEVRYELAKKSGCTGVWLSVWDKHVLAQRFHQKMGFVAVGEEPFKVSSDLQRDIIMYRPVS